MPSLKVLLSRCPCNSGGTSVFWKSFQRLSHFLSVHSTRGSGALMDWEGRSGVAQGVHVQEANSKSSLSRNCWSPGFWFKGPGHSYSCSSGGQTKSITEFGHLKLQTAGSLHRTGRKTLPRIWACLVPAFRPPMHTSSTAAEAERVQRRDRCPSCWVHTDPLDSPDFCQSSSILAWPNIWAQQTETCSLPMVTVPCVRSVNVVMGFMSCNPQAYVTCKTPWEAVGVCKEMGWKGSLPSMSWPSGGEIEEWSESELIGMCIWSQQGRENCSDWELPGGGSWHLTGVLRIQKMWMSEEDRAADIPSEKT